MTDPPIHEMTSEQAGEFLARKSAEWKARTAPPEKPSNSTEAKARLDALTADKAWSERYLKGGVDEVRAAKELTTMVAR